VCGRAFRLRRPSSAPYSLQFILLPPLAVLFAGVIFGWIVVRGSRAIGCPTATHNRLRGFASPTVSDRPCVSVRKVGPDWPSSEVGSPGTLGHGPDMEDRPMTYICALPLGYSSKLQEE
jgi:hypothetical protein